MKDWVWSVITAIILCYFGLGFAYTIYQGMIWFIFSSMCVIVNDIAAYLVGISFGRTRLI